MTHAEFMTSEDPRWREFLDGCPHDIYHLPEYARFSARHDSGEALAFLGVSGDDRLLIPLIRRSLPQALAAPPGWSDVVSPYGYASPLLVGGAGEPDVVGRLWAAFVALCERESIIAAFLRFHPLLALPGAAQWLSGLRCEGETVYLDLAAGDEELWRQTRENHRRGIRRLLRDGFTVVIDDWQHYEPFISLYRETMLRAGADPFYLFAHDYFAGLRQLAAERIHLCAVLAPDGQLAAAGLFFAHNGMVQFHLSGTALAYLDAAPSKLMFDHMRRWAVTNRYALLHLGGGVGCRNDSLFNFKAGFSSCRARFHTARMVCDRTRYAQLARRAGVEDEGNAVLDGYFPIYRRNGGTAAASEDVQ